MDINAFLNKINPPPDFGVARPRYDNNTAKKPPLPQKKYEPAENQPSASTIKAEEIGTEAHPPIYESEIGKEGLSVNIDRNSIINGIILSEILGKPKSRRAGR